jgi:hypothetical protein
VRRARCLPPDQRVADRGPRSGAGPRASGTRALDPQPGPAAGLARHHAGTPMTEWLAPTTRREACVVYPDDHESPSVSPVSNAVPARSRAYDRASQAGDSTTATVSVPVLALKSADSPRLNGEDRAHIARLAETETPLPPNPGSQAHHAGGRRHAPRDGRVLAGTRGNRRHLPRRKRSRHLPARGPGEHRARPAAIPGRPPRRRGADHRLAPAHVRPGDRPFGWLGGQDRGGHQKTALKRRPVAVERTGRKRRQGPSRGRSRGFGLTRLMPTIPSGHGDEDTALAGK